MPGAELRIGEVLLQITKYTSPCEKIAGAFLGDDFTRISQKLHAGWSRVSRARHRRRHRAAWAIR